MNTIALGKFLYTIIDVYIWVLIARIVLSYLPALNWQQQPWRTISGLVDPVLQPFRGLVPTIAGMDFSPILLFILLHLLQSLVRSVFLSGPML